MASYNITANVDQIVTKEIELVVTAGSEEEAQEKARLALNDYPQEITEPSVKRILTTKSRYWIPKSIDFTSIKEIPRRA